MALRLSHGLSDDDLTEIVDMRRNPSYYINHVHVMTILENGFLSI